ncbi:MAG: SOS response-associated peptidase, partial [Planctomycetales bacterium]|nr:SOS response-associated peptidase [Planctomycetales bacterium]
MCGRFTLRTPADELSELFSATLRDGLLLSPRYNIAPSQLVACVRQPPEGQRELVTLRWGLVPSWAKDAKIGYSLINARSETVANKPAFRSPFRRRRCLIPADGFFEWQAVPGSKTKQPHYITLQGGQPFAFAGLWERWIGPDGNPLESCSIITTEPNELMKTIHNRMPVILPP